MHASLSQVRVGSYCKHVTLPEKAMHSILLLREQRVCAKTGSRRYSYIKEATQNRPITLALLRATQPG